MLSLPLFYTVYLDQFLKTVTIHKFIIFASIRNPDDNDLHVLGIFSLR